MAAFQNLAWAVYRAGDNAKVLQELIDAGIPFLTLPQPISTEVKTKHLGLLNGFVFYRAWRYWVCVGYMPLAHANTIFERYQNLSIRAAGHAANPAPSEVKRCPMLEEARNHRFVQGRSNGEDLHELVEFIEQMQAEPDWPWVVAGYHIDTTEGLAALAAYIRDHRICAVYGQEGSYTASVEAKGARAPDNNQQWRERT